MLRKPLVFLFEGPTGWIREARRKSTNIERKEFTMSKSVSARVSSIALALLAGSVAFSPAAKASVAGSDHVPAILSEAKAEASKLQHDAATLESFTRSDLTLESHAYALNTVKDDVNALSALLVKLRDNRGDVAPAQQVALDRIAPVEAELAAATTAAIERLDKAPDGLRLPAYRGYLEAIYGKASQLAALVAEYVDYGRTKASVDRLTNRLE
jgi:hypothetical protein